MHWIYVRRSNKSYKMYNWLTEYMTWRSITVFTTARHESILHSHIPPFLEPIWILSTYLCLSSRSGIFLSDIAYRLRPFVTTYLINYNCASTEQKQKTVPLLPTRCYDAVSSKETFHFIQKCWYKRNVSHEDAKKIRHTRYDKHTFP